MGTVIPFTPSQAGPFQFTATLDGQDYVCNVTWNLWGQRWYLNIYTTNAALIVARALISSPPAPATVINLLFGYFATSTMVFDDKSQSFLINP